MICKKCRKKIQLDRVLKFQVFLVANKPKYTKEAFKEKYDRAERLIKKIDPDFYKLNKE